MNLTPWFLATVVVHAVVWLVLLSTGSFGAVLDLAVHSGLMLAIWRYAGTPGLLPYEARRRSFPLIWFATLVMGFAVYGNWFYPGIFDPARGTVDRLVRSLTVPGWLAAGVITPACLASYRLGKALSELRGYHWPRGGPAVWLRLRWPDVVMGINAAGAWWLLRPHADTIGAANIMTWGSAWSGRGAWPVPPSTLAAAALLLMMPVLVQWLNRLAMKPKKPALQHQFVGAAVIWGPLLAYFSPLWARWGVGVAAHGDAALPERWAFSLLALHFWPLLAACSAGSLLSLQGGAGLLAWRRKKPLTFGSPTGSPNSVEPRHGVDAGARKGKTDWSGTETGDQHSPPDPQTPGGEHPDGQGAGTAGLDSGKPGPKAASVLMRPGSRPDQGSRRREFARAMDELDNLIGLGAVKQEVRRLVSHVKVTQERQRRGLKTEGLAMHMAFLGRPGTGKTEVARIIGRLLYGLGLLDSGHLVETDRGGLVGEYIGHTAQKTRQQIQKAAGGVLFVDEAYALAPRQGVTHDFGYEAIDTLVKAMEDHRSQLVVILAGYPGEMDRLWSANPGLKSRVRYQITFPDYTVDELASIFYTMAAARGYRLTVDSSVAARTWLETAIRDTTFANARTVRNFLESAIVRQSVRCDQAGVRRLSNEELTTLLPEDLAEMAMGTLKPE